MIDLISLCALPRSYGERSVSALRRGWSGLFPPSNMKYNCQLLYLCEEEKGRLDEGKGRARAICPSAKSNMTHYCFNAEQITLRLTAWMMLLESIADRDSWSYREKGLVNSVLLSATQRSSILEVLDCALRNALILS